MHLKVYIKQLIDWRHIKTGKNLSATRETWVWSLGWEDPLEKGMATHSCILAWRIPWTEGAWWVTVHGITKNHD